MRYCPSCEEEYRDGVAECPECRTSTLTESEFAQRMEAAGRRPLDEPAFVIAGQADNAFQADLLAAELGAADIPVILHANRRGPLETATEPSNYVALRVPAEHLIHARELLAAAKERLFAEESEAEKAAEEEELASEGAAPRTS